MARRQRRLLPAPESATPGCCAVTWCAALPMTPAERRRCMLPDLVPGRCAVHAQAPFAELRPEPLAEDEEVVDGTFGLCVDCANVTVNGTRKLGECGECYGMGVCNEECSHGHSCEHECDACAGSGKCASCGGSGFGGVRKKAA